MKRITLCGSTKFKREFEAINKQLTLEGNVVYSVSCFGHADKIEFTKEQKEKLDLVHKLKIDNSDGIFVLDVDGYIGSSTRSEIDYAESTGKFVKYLSDFPDLKMICDATLPFFNQSTPSIQQGGQQEGVQIILDLFDRFMPKNVAVDDRKQMAMYEAYHRIKQLTALPAVSGGWVKCSADGFPEDGEYLVRFVDIHNEEQFCVASLQHLSRHSGDGAPIDAKWFVYPSGGHEITYKVTHWMPLPQSPKE